MSFGSTGDCFDNAAMEAFWASLNVRSPTSAATIHFATRHAAHSYLFEFIEVFYNRQRHQASLGHQTPAEYTARYRSHP